MKVLVTGASGFIGSRLARKLVEGGHSVTAQHNTGEIKNSSIETFQADFADTDFVLPEGNFDVVFHLAAATPMEKNKKTIKKVNYDGTVNFFNKIKDRTKFFIYVSGLGVFGDVDGKIVDEDTPLKPHTHYAKIRLDVQKYLETQCGDKLPLTTVYFGEVYGNGGWFTSQIISRLKSGKFKMPNGGNYFRCFVHVDDAVNALVSIAEKNATNESFIVTDSNPVLFKDFINHICDNLGVKHPGSVPSFLVKALLGGDFVKLLTTSIKTSNEKISKISKFEYPSYREGIQDVLSKIE